MKLPTRTSTYILSALLLLLVALVFYLYVTIDSPALQKAIEAKKAQSPGNLGTTTSTSSGNSRVTPSVQP